ncbi:MAG: phosphotransferase, partial [Acidimicrobiales bacterium]
AAGPTRVTPLRYRPGNRCVLRYDIGESAYFGKVLSGGRAAALATIAAELAAKQLTVPLVAFAPEWQLVVQADAAGPRAEAADLESCGRLLARLHAGATPPGPSCSLHEDAAELVDLVPSMRYVGICAEEFAGAVDRLRSWPSPEHRTVPSHGAFRLNQVHCGPGGPVMIDLDSFGWAEPERDVANLLAYLHWRGMRRGADQREGRAAFLAGYGAGLDGGRLRAFEAVSLLKIAGRRIRRFKTDEWLRLPDLIGAATGLLE